MIKEAYCSYEVSKLLKEKGFNEPIRCWYDNFQDFHKEGVIMSNTDCLPPTIMCPTHQMTMRWLREVHGIFIAINNDDLDFNWQCYDLINRENTLDPKILSESYAGYKTYEEAVEAALKYTLENLI